MEYQHITHDDVKPFVPEGAKILILGSLPSVASRKAGFFYAHKTNRFFRTLAGVFNEKEPLTTEERKAFLSKHHIALYDAIQECDIIGSSDSSIKNVVSAKPILDEIKKNHDIRAVFSAGKKSFEIYREYVGDDNLLLPSSSAANAAYSLEMLIESYSIILQYL